MVQGSFLERKWVEMGYTCGFFKKPGQKSSFILPGVPHKMHQFRKRKDMFFGGGERSPPPARVRTITIESIDKRFDATTGRRKEIKL